MTHEKPETHTCLRATDKIIEMIHVRDTDKGTIPESAGRINNADQFDSSHLAMTRNINFNSRNAQNRPQSPYQNRQHDFNSNPGRRSNNNTTRSQNQVCTHCKRTNHSSRECKSCFKCLKLGHFRHECRAPRSSNLN